ncbi:MAG: hypothetical protein PHU36_03855 [Syntrophomonadaceae bacterium]|nr:hypothetical protein [Syntrophomonadaceae bacterium]
MQDYRHFRHMTDQNGMLQFSLLSTPDAHSGYTLDDNARALIAALLNGFPDNEALNFARFLFNAQQEDGSWSNFYYNNTYSSRFDSEDSIGRAILACAIGIDCDFAPVHQLCLEMLKNNVARTLQFTSPRSIAYSLIGLCKVNNRGKNNWQNLIIERLCCNLQALYDTWHGPEWFWYENYLTYCNGILPQAMLAVYNYNGNKKALKIGRDSLDFLSSILFQPGYLNIIGNNGWYQRGGKIPLFDQQPVDAASIVCALNEGYLAIGSREYMDMAQKGYLWYHGENLNSQSMYDPLTGGCYDALTQEGVNRNQGAEAVLSLLLTELAISHNLQIKTEKTS